MAFQSQSPTGCRVRSQAFLLSVHLEVTSFVDSHTVHPVILLSVMVLLSQYPTSHSVHSQASLLSVHVEVKSFAEGHIVHPVVILLSVMDLQ
jgi:hypothetical protein